MIDTIDVNGDDSVDVQVFGVCWITHIQNKNKNNYIMDIKLNSRITKYLFIVLI